ncbi:7TM diverse intracellular signaling domain-containing protein [Ramlibacter sp.]|uniref:7TM diverse intracellular signaling domain-containing protein n=1 Tax=Ramlibacter sp. TaxID=1917967 RepID=UPI003D0F922B
MTLHRWLYALSVLLAVSACAVGARAAPIASASTSRVELTQDVGFLVDASSTMTVADVAAAAERGAMKQVGAARIPLLRIDRGEAFWIRYDVAADATAPRDWLFEAGRANIDRVQVFVRAADGGWTSWPEVGAARPFSARIVDHRHFVYPVRLEPGRTTTVFIRVVYAGPSSPKAALWQPEALAEADRAVLGLSGLYFGLVFGMLLYNLLLFVSVKDRAYLLYAGCVACTAGAFAGSSGMGAQYVWGEWGAWTAQLMYTFYGGALVFSASLTRQFLHTRDRLPAFDKALRVVAWTAAAGTIGAAVLPSNLGLMCILLQGMAATILVPGAAVVGLVRRWPGAVFFCAAWGALYAGVFMVLGRTFALYRDTVLTDNALAIASAFEMVLLALALADRINAEKRLRIEAQALTLGVLQASQALSSETRLDRLHAKACEIMARLAHADSVRLLLRDADLQAWMIHEEGGAPVPADSAAARGHVDLAAVGEIERTRAPVAAGDGRLLVPVVHRGELNAIVVVQRRGARGEFPPAVRSALEGIAGPLAVSLENVLRVERLEQHVADRTHELREAQQRLVATAHRAGMAELATNVLHHVGNSLNSVNVSGELLRGQLRRTRVARLADAVDLLDSHAADLPGFFARDEKGAILPVYLGELAQALQRETEEMQAHLLRLIASIDDIRQVVAAQQAYAGSAAPTQAPN